MGERRSTSVPARSTGPGEKLFLDYAGASLWLTDPTTSTRTPVTLFVAVLGASNYTYAEATRAADLPSWIGSHVHAFDYPGGLPAALIPDNHKSAILHPDRYEPDLHPTYLELAGRQRRSRER